MKPNETEKRTRDTRDNRRNQLIDATIRVISHSGLSQTTIAKVTQEANLSAGIVSFYFDSKEKLLLGTLLNLSTEFRDTIGKALSSHVNAKDKLTAVIETYFDPILCNPEKIAVWWAFCSESSARKEYIKICGDQDAWFQQTLAVLTSELCTEFGREPTEANVISRGLEGIMDGLWQEHLYQPERFDQESARNICIEYLNTLFPGLQAGAGLQDAESITLDESDITDQHLPPWTYTDEEFLELEKQELFRKNWLLVGHVSDIAEPRSFMTLDAVDERALVIRGNDNVIRAFHNVCRHRGAKLKSEASGKCGHALTCPFHGWTYKLEGDLIGVPAESTFEDLDKTQNGLVPIEVEEWMGFVFVRFIPGGPSMQEMMQPVEDIFEPYQMENMVKLDGSDYEDIRPYNWKVVHDIDNEGYHVPIGHPSLQQLYGKTYEDSVQDGIPVSWGYINDKPASNWSVKMYQKILPEYDHLPDDNSRLWQYGGIFPSMVIGLYPDSIEFYMTLPLTTETTIYRGASYALPDKRREATVAQYLNRRINMETEKEDESFVAQLQEGMKSSAFPEPKLSTIEQGVRDFHQSIQNALPVAKLKEHPGPGNVSTVNESLASV